MFNITALLTAISGKETKHLNVQDILKTDPLMSFDKAVQLGMMETANEAIVEVKALATSLDRLIVMTNEIIGIMDTCGLTQAAIYKRRLKVLTNLSRIAEEFKPEFNHQFSQK
jgi:hypothetical protein